ncbi:unnamed protein product [Caenorhabditis angaria]|uniref:Peptidase M13 C-terminal domain-containing protein n=1 Tax=Caenorhabditis angaria TaxID=860376 RepID=A0A9P1IGP9_9PELO|nr:unnamed protein product [Caenorhabditis angaria]
MRSTNLTPTKSKTTIGIVNNNEKKKSKLKMLLLSLGAVMVTILAFAIISVAIYFSKAEDTISSQNPTIGSTTSSKQHISSTETIPKSSLPVETICETVECQQFADHMKLFMNQSVDPCDDFYEHICGNYPDSWASSNLGHYSYKNRIQLYKFVRKFKGETKSEKIAMATFRKCKTTRNDSELDKSFWKQKTNIDLTDMLIEMAKVKIHKSGFLINNVDYGDELNKNNEKFFTLTIEKGRRGRNDSIVKIEDIADEIKSFDLRRYLKSLLPEENRDDKFDWVVKVNVNHMKSLEKVVKKKGVSRIRKALYKKWKGILNAFIIGNSTNVNLNWLCFLQMEKLFPGTLLTMYIKHFVGAEILKRSKKLFETVKETFIKIIDENEWIDENLKHLLIEEVSHIKASIGIPDEHENQENIDRMYARIGEDYKNQSYLTLVRNLLKMNSEETILRVARMEQITYTLRPKGRVSPSFNQKHHRLHGQQFFPTFRMNLPRLHESLPEWVMIASFASTLGHEMGHSFDTKRFDKNHLMQSYNLTTKTKNEFEKRLDCIKQQFSYFKFPDGSFSNGSRTIKEDTCDSIGFDIAYRIFENLKPDAKFRKLPGFENSTTEQLFFLGKGQILCAKKITPAGIEGFKKDVHSYEKFRVNGVMANSKEFAKAFGCEIGKPMNPEKKCKLFTIFYILQGENEGKLETAALERVETSRQAEIFTTPSYFETSTPATILTTFVTSKSSISVPTSKIPVAKVCRTDECQKFAKRMKSMMNPNIDPCQDFFENICGNYPESSTQFGIYGEQLYENLIKFLKMLKTFKPETKSEKIAMVTFEKCKNTREDLELDESFWNRNDEDLTAILIEMAKINLNKPGFLKNYINYGKEIKKNQRFLTLTIIKGFEFGTEIEKAWNSSTSYYYLSEMGNAIELAAEIQSFDLKKYVRNLLPEENRNDKFEWNVLVSKHDLTRLDAVVKVLGVPKIRQILLKT